MRMVIDNDKKKEWPLWSLFFFVIKGVHQVEKVFAFLCGGRICSCWHVVKEHWQDILHGLAFGVSI